LLQVGVDLRPTQLTTIRRYDRPHDLNMIGQGLKSPTFCLTKTDAFQ